MKNKRITKRQILLIVCCLLFFIGISAGAFLSVKNGTVIEISGSTENSSFIKEFIDINKFMVLVMICGYIPGTAFLLYFLVAYKGFSIGYTVFSIAEADFMKRLSITFAFIPAEFIISFFIIFCTSYFRSFKKPVFSSKGYRQDVNKHKAEILILSITGNIISFICALWKISAVNLLP